VVRASDANAGREKMGQRDYQIKGNKESLWEKGEKIKGKEKKNSEETRENRSFDGREKKF